MTEIRGQRSEVSSHKSGFIRDFTLSPLTSVLSPVGAMLLALCFSAEAQQQKIPRVGWLTGSSLSDNPDRIVAFRQGLRELGYVEAKNIIIEWRSAEGNRDRERTLAVELIQLKVDVIVTGGGGSTRAAKEATSQFPLS